QGVLGKWCCIPSPPHVLHGAEVPRSKSLLFLQVLNEYFHNVCELDLVFNFYKVYTVVDEMFLAGEIRETSQTKVLKQLLMLQSLE
ncbi:AP-2 complex subunit sigma, partial [Python bivittatus]